MKDKNLHNNKGGFKLPEGYFDDFEAKLSSKMASKIPAKDGFQIPDNYFETVTDKILTKIEEDSKPEVPVRKLFGKKRFYYIGYAVAAGLALLVLLNIIPKSEQEVDWNDVASTEIENYIEEGYLSFNAYEYATIYEEVDLSEIQIEEEPIESEELLDYLYENVNAFDNLIIEN